ncbi:hypothetical protein LguiB_005366 [Lonicera macranthoides]
MRQIYIGEINELEKGYETGDVDSDECPSPDSSDEEGGVRVKQKFPVFNLKIEMKNIEIMKEMKFANHDELKSTLRKFSIIKGAGFSHNAANHEIPKFELQALKMVEN